MGNASSSNQVTSQDRAVLDMKLQRDKLKRYQKSIQTVLDREHELAKECLQRGEKSKALLALRKRKYQEQLLGKTDGHLETLEQLTSTIEFSLIQKDVVYGLQQGNEVLKAINKEMSLETVEKLMGETADAIAYQKEVSELLAQNMSNEDEDAVEDEFEAMQQEALREKNANAITQQEMPKLPNAPNTDLEVTDEQRQKRRAEERRLRNERQAVPA